MAQLTVLSCDLRSLSRCEILVWFVQSVVTAGNWLRPSFICSAFAKLRLHFSCSQELMSRPLFCRDVIQLSRVFKLIVTQICWVAYFLVATWNLGRVQVFSLLSAILVVTFPSSYLVATSFLSLNISLQFFYFWSRPHCSALFWNICHDLGSRCQLC